MALISHEGGGGPARAAGASSRRGGAPSAPAPSSAAAPRRLLSVLMPVYNERAFLRRCVERVLAAPLPDGVDREIVMVDDASNDGTHALVAELAAAHPEIRAFRQPRNAGKGAAIRRAVEEMKGDLAVFQDADLEYDPRDYARLLSPLLHDGADAVYGSRFAGSPRRRILDYYHEKGNKFLTFASNACTGLNLSDMETCYKAFRADLLRSLPIRSRRFGIEPEITAKLAKRRATIYEVPISYLGRGYADGKKIGVRDGFSALWTIFRYWLVDDCFHDRPGHAMLHSLARARRYAQWQAAALRPYMGDRILELGAGIGHFSRLLPRRERLTVAESDPAYLEQLDRAFRGNELVTVARFDPASDDGLDRLAADGYDTVVALNLLQRLDDDAAALARIRRLLPAGGRLLAIVPQHPWLSGALDRAAGNRRRYRRADFAAKLAAAGLRPTVLRGFNGFATPWRWLVSVALGRPTFGRVGLKVFDALAPLMRPLDRIVPLPGQSLLCVAEAE